MKNSFFEPNTGVRSNVWDDIDLINQWEKERLGYPTQKPLALLERIIKAVATLTTLSSMPFVDAVRHGSGRESRPSMDRY